MSDSGAALNGWNYSHAAGRTARAGLDALLTVLLAPACAVCHSLLPEPTQGPICVHCWQTIPRLTPPLCTRCGDPLPSWRVRTGVHAHCPGCRRRRTLISRARAVGPYEGTLRQIVHLLKYERRHTLAVRLGALMREHGSAVLADADCVVPVPLHPRRRRTRGFNQAAELARHLGLPVVGALRRTIATRPQMELPAARRRDNVRNAFAPSRSLGWRPAASGMRGARVVVVDDVVTTGATVDACARVLRQMGARDVRALTLARVARVPRS